ncbi:MAG TPA: type II toxin-antitoxin system prevent-host-death family antitoxin [Rhodanobacteraceae bacterium]
MGYEEIISLSEFKSHATGWIKKLESQPPVVLTQNGRGVAVVQNYEIYRQDRIRMAMLQRALQAEEDHREGRTISHAQMMREIDELLGPNLAEAEPVESKSVARKKARRG